MPLSEEARMEVYLPDLPAPAYQRLLDALEQEFSYTFWGCTILHSLNGSYLSNYGLTIKDRVNLLYTDTPFAFSENQATLSQYVDELRSAAFQALDEEAIFVAVYPVFHAA